MARLFAGERPDPGGYLCLHCAYRLELAAGEPLPACPRCSHGDWRPAGDDAQPAAAPPPLGAWRRTGLAALRYGLPAALVLFAIVLLAIDPGGFGIEGFGLFAGSGLSILLLNWLFRLGVTSDADRDREERAREYFERHGRWPDEP